MRICVITYYCKVVLGPGEQLCTLFSRGTGTPEDRDLFRVLETRLRDERFESVKGEYVI
jgi:hypothetical protein